MSLRWLGAAAFWSSAALAQTVPAPGAPAAKETVAVMPLTGSGVDAEVLRALDAAFVFAVADLGPYKTISPAEINAQLGRERMKEAAGCPPDSVSCAAEIVGALGAPLLLQGQVARLGGKLRVTLALIDTRSQEVLKRGQGTSVDDVRAYEGAVDAAVR